MSVNKYDKINNRLLPFAGNGGGGGGGGTVYQKTLEAGETSIDFTDNAIDSDACFDFYADQDHSDVMPTGYSVSGTTVTLTYTAQSEDVVVGIKISKGVVLDG